VLFYVGLKALMIFQHELSDNFLDLPRLYGVLENQVLGLATVFASVADLLVSK